MRDVVSTLSFSSSSSSFPICAIIIRNRFDSASTVACIRSDRILDFENGGSLLGSFKTESQPTDNIEERRERRIYAIFT